MEVLVDEEGRPAVVFKGNVARTQGTKCRQSVRWYLKRGKTRTWTFKARRQERSVGCGGQLIAREWRTEKLRPAAVVYGERRESWA